MRKYALLLLACFSYAACQPRQISTFFAGLAVPTGGEDGKNYNPGLSVGFEPLSTLGPFFSCGGHIEYSWMTKKLSNPAPDSARGGTHVWDIAVVPQLSLPLNSAVSLHAEVSPGIYIKYDYFQDRGTLSPPFLCVSTGNSISVNNYIFSLKFKNILDGRRIILNWVTLSIGFRVM
jgi:hypothetical protein